MKFRRFPKIWIRWAPPNLINLVSPWNSLPVWNDFMVRSKMFPIIPLQIAEICLPKHAKPHDATWREALKLVVLVCFPSDSQWIVLDIGWLCVWDHFKSAYNWQFRINLQPVYSLLVPKCLTGVSRFLIAELRLSWWTHCRPELPKEWHDRKLP